MLNENDFFGTSDIAFVACALCFGGVIDSVDRSTHRAVFYIRREKGLDELLQAFHSHSLQVEPLAYFNALKEAKSRLYAPAVP